jgi:hypothetical protein
MFRVKEPSEMNSFILRLALISAILLCIQSAQTQQAAKPKASAASQSAASQSAAQPSAEMQSLIKALSGTWSLTAQFAGSNAIFKGEEVWHAGPGGLTLVEEESLHSPGRDLLLLGVIWWDNTTQSFHGMECNNGLAYGCDLKGALNDITLEWDGKQLVLTEQENHNGKKTVWHEAFSEITATSFTQTGDSSDAAGGPSTRVLTIHATKVADVRK